jgi:hypothetical protein
MLAAQGLEKDEQHAMLKALRELKYTSQQITEVDAQHKTKLEAQL